MVRVVLHPGTKDYVHGGQVPIYSRIHGVGTATMSTAAGINILGDGLHVRTSL